MDLERLVPFAFVAYCTMAGIVLTVIPWTLGWTQMLSYLPFAGAGVLKLPLARGVLSGFGLVHLIWGLHDLHQILRSDGGRL